MLSLAVLGGLIISCRVVYAASAASGTFNVLSMNVAGLPEILNGNGESGDKTTNTMIIGQVRQNPLKHTNVHERKMTRLHV